MLDRKRHAMVDTDGRGLTLANHPADIEDRDGAPPLMRASRRRWPFVQLAVMDGGYAGGRLWRGSRRFRYDHPRRDRAQTKAAGRLCCSCAALGDREILRLDRPQPQAR
jgi:hypothetical protein